MNWESVFFNVSNYIAILNDCVNCFMKLVDDIKIRADFILFWMNPHFNLQACRIIFVVKMGSTPY